jgi:hypothetical protein
MSEDVKIYAVKESGDLKLLGEADGGGENPALLIDLLLDDNPRLREREFAVVDSEGVLTYVTVNGDEPVNPRRDISVSGPATTTGGRTRSEGGRKRGGRRKAAAEPADEPDEGEEKPKKRGRPKGTKNKSTAKKPGPKPKAKGKAKAKGGAKKGSAKKSGGNKAAKKGKKASPFRSKPDDE